MKRWFKIEWLVPAKNAIGGKAYWTALSNSQGFPHLIDDLATAREGCRRAKEHYHTENVRIIQVTEEVIEPCSTP